MKEEKQKRIIDYLNDFLDWLDVEKGLSSKTQENYARFLKKFFEWLKINNLESLKPYQLSPDHIYQYKTFLSRKLKKPLETIDSELLLNCAETIFELFCRKRYKIFATRKSKVAKEKN